MNENRFKKQFKFPACTTQPWKYLIPIEIREDTLKKIRQESIEAYGYPMDECPKRLTCFKKECIGRPLPWKSQTAQPYLEKLKANSNIVNEELFISGCDNCPIKLSCKSPCQQVNDYINRARIKDAPLVFQDNLENHVVLVESENIRSNIFTNIDIPWDCLTEKKQQIIKKYLYEGKDFLTLAKELDLNNQARAKYEFYSSLTKLSKHAVMRKFIEEYRHELSDKQLEILNLLFIQNNTQADVAKAKDITKQSVQQVLTRLISKYKIRWSVFVRKQGNKVIYNVPEIFK